MIKKTNKDFFLRGYELAMQKVNSLVKVADLAALQSEYGIACSLNILAAEEVIKAYALITKHTFPEYDLNDFDDMFSKHEVKHRHIILLAEMQERIRARLEIFVSILEPFVLIVKNAPDNLKKTGSPAYEDLMKHHDYYKKQSQRKLNIEEIGTWIKNANQEKNNGFYQDMDMKGGRWINQTFTKSKFQKERKYTDELIETVLNAKNSQERYGENKKFLDSL